MRRKPGQLVGLEVAVLEAALSLGAKGIGEFYGFLIAKEMKALARARFRTAYGTLYKTLDRMENAGLLDSNWEDPERALDEGRPRRRFYRVTGEGERAYKQSQQVLVRGRLADSAGLP